MKVMELQTDIEANPFGETTLLIRMRICQEWLR